MDTQINESILSDAIRAEQEKQKSDHMSYLPDMEVIESDIEKKVADALARFDASRYTETDVLSALSKASLKPDDFAALLSPAAAPYLEEIAQRAREERRRYFGCNVTMMTPLYISNYCENYCIYCGFNSHNHIGRARLDTDGIRRELAAIAKSRLEEILLLVGESRKMADVSYIASAVEMAREYFPVIGLEVYPMNSDEYALLQKCGADYVTVFQETYNSDRYAKLHLAGHKRVWPYRFHAQERALMGGMRGVTFAALLGLDDFRGDAYATGLHAYYVQQKYPHAEIGFSCPRLRPIINNERIRPMNVGERELLQIVCAYRLFMPYASIMVSSRECARVRDNLIQICATKVSAGADTGIGGHSGEKKDGDDQFEIDDGRSFDEMYRAIKNLGLQPVMRDYIRV